MLGHAQVKGYEFLKWNFNPFNVTTKIETKGSTNYWYDTNIAWIIEMFNKPVTINPKTIAFLNAFSSKLKA